jgi:Uncharacterized conserved protein
MKHLVFVYGTLKKGHGNNGLLCNSRFVGNGVTQDRFWMLSGGFPVLLRGNEAQASGEVYEVDTNTLSRLDRLESNGVMYNREATTVMVQGVPTVCLAYIGVENFWRGHVAHLHAVPVADGQYNWGQ